MLQRWHIGGRAFPAAFPAFGRSPPPLHSRVHSASLLAAVRCSITEELLTVDAFYLGYVRVLKKDGARIVKKAADVNAAGRAAMQTARERKRVRKVNIHDVGLILLRRVPRARTFTHPRTRRHPPVWHGASDMRLVLSNAR